MTMSLLETPVGARTRTLRDYQAEAVDAVRAQWATGNHRTAIVLATGLGKTDCIARIATDEARAGGRVLIMAHRAELLDQITERCLMHDAAIPVGRVQATINQTRRPITVAMAQTMAGDSRRARMVPPTLVIVDECHHAASPSYMKVLRWAGCFADDAPTRLLGVTATMTRADKRGLGDVFQSHAIERGIIFGVEQGYLVRPHGRVVVGEHLDLANAKTSKGDYQDGELGDMVAQDADQIVASWIEHAGDRLTVAFVPSVSSASQLADAFRARGVAAAEVYGSTSHPERQGIYRDLAAGRVRVLVNVMVATEGFDCPPISCVLNARPTKLSGLYQQMIGRGLRLSPGKTDCLVLDVVGASRTQTLRTLVELLPSAKYVATEVEVLPCTVCGGYSGRKPAVVALALERGMTPCVCPCGVCGEGQASCECEPEPIFRDPDGGRRRLRSPGRYEDLDLLGLAGDDGSDLNWLTTPDGVPFLAARNRIASVYQEDNGLWTAAHVAAWGPRSPELLVEFASREHAIAVVENWASAQGVFPRSAPWRTARTRASPDQQDKAARYGIADPDTYTKGAIADAIDIARASRQLRKEAR